MKLAPSNLRTRRGGFTLIELLVAAALCVVIMTVLAISFRSGMDTMSQMKSVADMTDHLRAAEVVIINDLQTPHLEDDAGLTVSLSDPIVNRVWSGSSRNWNGPRKGFFRITQGSAPVKAPDATGNPLGLSSPLSAPGTPVEDGYIWEGTLDGVHYYRARDHWMHFTVKKSGLTRQDIFTASVDPPSVAVDPDLRTGFSSTGNLSSQWAEIAYFMEPTPQVVAGTPPSGQYRLYTLYRRQLTVAQTAPFMAVPITPPLSIDVSLNGTTLNTPLSITNPANRLPIVATTPPIPPVSFQRPQKLPPPNEGRDVHLSNVISFQIQVMTDGSNEFRDPYDIGDPGPRTSSTPMVVMDPQPWPRTWDTGNRLPGDATRIRGVQIHIRVYDIRNAITRQMTITQAL